MKICDIFSSRGEGYFRELEADAVRAVSSASASVIATGGGVPLRGESIDALRENGRIYFIDRSPENLIPTSDRPLSSTKEDILKRYRERYGIYSEACDVRIDADCDAECVADKILKDFLQSITDIRKAEF